MDQAALDCERWMIRQNITTNREALKRQVDQSQKKAVPIEFGTAFFDSMFSCRQLTGKMFT
jgi:hypothetical protein